MKAIVARYMDGNKVVGYYVKDENERVVYVDRKTVEGMALNRQLINCKAQECNGQVVLKGIGIRLKELPKVNIKKENLVQTDKFKIDARIIRDKEVIGYRIKNLRSGECKLLRKVLVMKLVKEKRVVNARVQKYRDNEIIRGIGCDLSHLERINYDYRMD